ncbi:MAG: aldehyde ferredoxin oxidoreductase [Nanoarchaeota archaeon]|nr:aldehyde ferredoxin oxidoreductase [Nanoarchaeota archaeon]
MLAVRIYSYGQLWINDNPMTKKNIPQKALVLNAATGKGKIADIGDSKILGPVDYALRLTEEDDYFVFGRGILSGSSIPGTNRLVFCGMSPLWEAFYISTLGGAGVEFFGTGLNYVAIKNRAAQPSVLIIDRRNDETIFSLVPAKKSLYTGKNNRILTTYRLQENLFKEYGKDYKKPRILATGPASHHTQSGAILSSNIKSGNITSVDSWAGRGGLGSKLVQQHNIIGMVFGGDHVSNNENLRNITGLNELFQKKFNEKYHKVVIANTGKYRYDEALKTGGTFGVNYTLLKKWIIYFNWRSIYSGDEEREFVHQEFILNHYLRQFNEETIKPKCQDSCGEACPVVCKKMHGFFKKDYEPYQAGGPNCGIFDQRAAEKLNFEMDSLGYDAIEAGNMIGWLMEALYIGILDKEKLGLELMPKFDFENFDVVEDSARNSKIAVEILRFITFSSDSLALILRKNIRSASLYLDKIYSGRTEEKKKKFTDIALFNSYGGQGSIAPNQYWVPGMFLPMPTMGKYFQYYGADFLPPRDLGIKSSERMVKELFSDNIALCRFHRKWSEEIVEDIVNYVYGTDIDLYSHHKEIAKKIFSKYKGTGFWEPQRVIDVVYKYIEKIARTEKKDSQAHAWLEKFNQDKDKAAKEYWQEMLDGTREDFE